MNNKGVLLLTVLDAVSFVFGGILAVLSYMKADDPTQSPWPWLLGVFSLMGMVMTFIGMARLSKKEPL